MPSPLGRSPSWRSVRGRLCERTFRSGHAPRGMLLPRPPSQAPVTVSSQFLPPFPSPVIPAASRACGIFAFDCFVRFPSNVLTSASTNRSNFFFLSPGRSPPSPPRYSVLSPSFPSSLSVFCALPSLGEWLPFSGTCAFVRLCAGKSLCTGSSNRFLSLLPPVIQFFFFFLSRPSFAST